MIRIFLTVIFSIIFIYSNISAESKEKIVDKISSILSELPSGTRTGILIYNPLTQDTIYSKNIFTPMIPASLTKIFTTATALSLMGNDYKLSTILFSDDLNIKDGIINGNLYIKGFGNGTFSIDDLQQFVLKLKNLGIEEITGNIIGDDSFFDNIYYREDWIPDESANVKLPPVSALVLDRNKTIMKRKRGRRTIYISENFKNPPLKIAQKFKELIEDNNIIVKGSAKSGVTPDNVLEIAESSVTISDAR